MTEPFSNCIAVAKAELTTAKKLISAEIASYPSPISGCDAQFNHLIAERKKVLDALDQLNQVVFVPTPRSPSPEAGVESRVACLLVPHRLTAP